MSDPRYWVGFSLIPGIGPVKAGRLLECFGGLEAAWWAASAELSRAGLDARTVEAIVSRRRDIDLDREMERLDQQSVTVIPLDSSAYPERLRHIYGPPMVLYVKGQLRPEDEWAVGVVGTRRATAYGREVVERIVPGLTRSGVTIVSGLAKGIDSYAHRVALEGGGRTIAVLGNGVDITYPAENARLAREIAENGAVVSEYPLGTSPEASNFPARNRIISGLSLGTLVVEAGDRSGALITADFALEQGREVFAVPGSILSRGSIGTNRLIQQSGAKLTVCADDILQELNLRMVPQQMEMRQLLPESEAEMTLLNMLKSEPVHIDELVRGSALPVAEVGATLTMMELKGMIRHLGGSVYVASP